jgi:hypothetical protein
MNIVKKKKSNPACQTTRHHAMLLRMQHIQQSFVKRE